VAPGWTSITAVEIRVIGQIVHGRRDSTAASAQAPPSRAVQSSYARTRPYTESWSVSWAEGYLGLWLTFKGFNAAAPVLALARPEQGIRDEAVRSAAAAA
jgi:hypothetical protein